MRYQHPTPIQSHAVPVALAGSDLMCCAQTGSGKTCAFLLPVVSSLAAGRSRQQQFQGIASCPAALVLAPTRELALQIEVEAQKLTNRSPIISGVVYGGASARGQLTRLAQGVDILCATPGRLQEFVDRGVVGLSKVG